MRIAMLSWESLHSIPVGGLAPHVTELAAALGRRGHDVHVITRMGPQQPQYDVVDGVHYHRCPVSHEPDFVQYIRGMCGAFMDRLVEAERFYGRPFDVVHGHDWLCTEALQGAKERGRGVLLTMHSTEYGRCGNQNLEGISARIRHIEGAGIGRADRVICVSRALRDEVSELYAAPGEKLEVIYNGVTVERFDLEVDVEEVRAGHGLHRDEPLVLFVGRLAWQKGPDLLLEAVPQVLHHAPDARFFFVGDGDMRPALEGVAGSKGLFKPVRFLGYRNGRDLVELYRAADVVCVPSRNEPFGIVILESWSAEKPVVVTRNGGPSEIVRDQENGLFVSATADSISYGVCTALADAENAQRLGRNGRHEAETRYSWDVIATSTEGLYQSI
jgi:glycosyltransferase involved in cell wall biosynthesis